MSDIILSPGQDAAFADISRWYHGKDTGQEFVLAGYAGTGKSTLANKINQETGKEAYFCAFTGKAAHVLRQKGCSASTLHSALYKPVPNEEVRALERFDFASAITCHKAQGSEFDNVLIYNEPVGGNAEDCRRWLYSAITRAKNKVILVEP